MYTPDTKILKRYADVLVRFALWSGEGIRPGDIVYLQVSESAKPLLFELQRSILEAGGHYITNFIPEGGQRIIYEHGTPEQIGFFPKDYFLEIVNTCDHLIRIESTWDKFELKGVDPRKIMSRQVAAKFYMDARERKEDAGKLTWTIGLYGTEEMAKQVGMSVEEYWDQIIQACFLDEEDPILKWREIFSDMDRLLKTLTDMEISDIHVEGEDVDLQIRMGERRKWLGGSGRNIPSFEIFTSPDWRGTNGHIRFNQPLYRYGNKIEGIELTFRDGLVVNATALKGEELLKELIAAENANKIGEFSLTDRRFSRITKLMGETLYDENIGGRFGNTHIAIGTSYRESLRTGQSGMTEEDWDGLGFNSSPIHVDIMSTSNRKVTATLSDGTRTVIYEDGEFKV